ncbi:dehydrodolichyl diphosphate synthase complex subunit nus1-like [Branchiostoma floridae]|uniref:ditrans,polycis-polyprenyl diphosphate synthase [(2E,6E)-farnesyldiphosphate specific] n=1 Tax=Branchiostoma floridae TaxID=7739 RepID=C3YXC5_BRAFL|nr:dehydrodolichyl diphosphate synthase complex subunit nus1-like [Branchiostoma floridae]|eukprot:XP_002599131.1 hypothetical protein BRAFLDRAFT_81798 [Branchiostoma floridae]
MILHQVLLYLVHTLLAIRTWLASLYHGLKKPLAFKHRKRTVPRIKSDSKALSRLPIHVGLVVVEEDFRYGDLASLVVWCAAMGISYISLYDSQGILKRNNTSLWQEIMKQQQELLGEDSNKYSIELVTGNRTTTQLTGQKYSVEVRLLSSEDGRTDLLQAAQRWCQAVEARRKKVGDLEPTALEGLLQATKGAPDVDLVLKFGTVDSLLGFLPWQIRLTEILSLPTHHSIDYQTFLLALQSFGNIEQRFGK